MEKKTKKTLKVEIKTKLGKLTFETDYATMRKELGIESRSERKIETDFVNWIEQGPDWVADFLAGQWTGFLLNGTTSLLQRRYAVKKELCDSPSCSDKSIHNGSHSMTFEKVGEFEISISACEASKEKTRVHFLGKGFVETCGS